MIETHQPLDLIQEYQQIKENILECKKKFSIKKIAVNSRSFVSTIDENPKIIHVSCHGDEIKKNGFYLAFEKECTGEEDQFMET